MGLFGKKKIEGKTAGKWYILGLEEKDPKQQIECYSKCLELDSKHAYAWYYKELAFDELQQYEEAITCYDKALNINPKYAKARFIKRIALGKLELYKEAILCCNKAISINSNNMNKWDNKKNAFDELEK